MSFCTYGKDYIKDGYTLIDNVFLSSYLPAAHPVDCKVYLFGMFLASFGEFEDNSIEKMALALKLSEERITEAFKYWEEQGLVSVSKSHPLKITYHSVKTPNTPVIRLNAKKYSTFVEEMARLFPEKVLTPNELSSYIELMQLNKIEVNAMLMIVQYCTEIKGAASTPYILAVAADWARQNIVSEKAVSEHIEELENNSEDIRMIMRALGLKSLAGLDERQLYLKWTKEYGYEMDAILVAARSCKRRGGMNKLSKVMEELYNGGAITASEVATYLQSKEDNNNLTMDIVKALGTYYSSFEMILEVYVLPWKVKGFDDNALRTIAKFCFLRNIRTLDAMGDMVEKFYKLGLLTAESIDAYINEQVAIDEFIKEVLSEAGSQTFVSNRDRQFYRTFVDNWGFSHEVILAVARENVGKPFPMTHINRILASLKENNIFGIEEVNKFLSESKDKPVSKKSPKKEEYLKQDYTKEQLSSLFRDPDEIEEI